MDQNQLLSAAVETGLDLLERHGPFMPFCKAISASGEPYLYCAASDNNFTVAQASESIKNNVLRDLQERQLIGVAFCYHTRVRFADSVEKVPAVEVELHYRGQSAVVWYFPYKIENGTAKVLEYYTKAAEEEIFPGG